MSDTIYTYIADHELAMLLKAAAEAGKRVRVEADGETFEIEVNPPTKPRDIWEDYDPEAAREAWRALAGVLADSDMDPDDLIRQIKEERE